MTAIAHALLITGTDTDVGKTIVTSALVAHSLATYPHHRLGLMKPVQSGVGDLECYQDLFPELGQRPEETTPQRFTAPLAPPLAAAQEGREIDLGLVWSTLQRFLSDRDWVIIEALGGLGSPVTDEWTVADLAAAWRLPIALVVPVKLGAIAQAVANVALARQQGLALRGLVLNCTTPEAMTHLDDWAPVGLIESLTQVPILGTMPWLPDCRDRDRLAAIAQDWHLDPLLPNFGTGTPQISVP